MRTALETMNLYIGLHKDIPFDAIMRLCEYTAQLEERVQDLETALRFFGHHKPGCNTELSAYEIGETGAAPWCTCGLDQVLGGE